MKQNKYKVERELQQKTMDSFQQIDKHLFTIDYQNNYDLPRMLRGGVDNVVQMTFRAQYMMKTPRPMLNPLHGGFACSTFNAFTPEGHHIMGRNFDYKDAPCFIVWTHPDKGYKSVSISEGSFMAYGYKYCYPADMKNRMRMLASAYVCMDGINEKGLAIAVLEIKAKSTRQSTGKEPITTPLIIRRILDTCATVEQAIKVFGLYDIHDSFFVNYHYQVVDAKGNSAVIEFINNEMRVMRAKETEYFPERYQYSANHFTQPDGDNRKEFGRERTALMKARLNEQDGVMTEKEAMGLLEDCKLYYKHKWMGHMVTSLWSAVYNTTEKSIVLCAGMDYEHVYRVYVDQPSKVEKAW